MFSPQVRSYFQVACGYGELEQPDLEAEVGNRQSGHYFRVQLQLSDHAPRNIDAFAFSCPRCVPAIACGAYLHGALVGHPVGRARELTTEALLHALGGLPQERLFYAWMAVEAVRQALKGNLE